MKKMFILITLMALFQTVFAQETANATNSQKNEKTEVRKTNTTFAMVWKENGTGTSNQTITFSREFTAALNGKQPFILVTPTSNNEGFYISDLNDKGFIVKKGNRIKTEKEFRFNWQAEKPF